MLELKPGFSSPSSDKILFVLKKRKFCRVHHFHTQNVVQRGWGLCLKSSALNLWYAPTFLPLPLTNILSTLQTILVIGPRLFLVNAMNWSLIQSISLTDTETEKTVCVFLLHHTWGINLKKLDTHTNSSQQVLWKIVHSFICLLLGGRERKRIVVCFLKLSTISGINYLWYWKQSTEISFCCDLTFCCWHQTWK